MEAGCKAGSCCVCCLEPEVSKSGTSAITPFTLQGNAGKLDGEGRSELQSLFGGLEMGREGRGSEAISWLDFSQSSSSSSMLSRSLRRRSRSSLHSLESGQERSNAKISS